MKRMRKLIVLGAAGLGAVVMYLLDPADGKRRRAIAKDKAAATIRDLNHRAGRRARYIEGKAHGVAHELRGERPKPLQNDATLKHKIESEVLRHFDTSRINVNVEDGVAVLRGEVDDATDVGRLENAVEDVQGVVGVRNLVHTSSSR